MKWLGAAGAAVVLATLTTIAACGSDDDPSKPGDAGVDGIFNPTCQTRCSSDLHEILDCNSVVVRRCPEGEGCSPTGACQPACESARSNKSTLGCDYYAVGPATQGQSDGSCFAAFIANTWGTSVNIGVSYNGQPLDIGGFARIPVGSGSSITYQPLPNGSLPSGQVAILFLADFQQPGIEFPVRCPAGVTAAVTNAAVSSSAPSILRAFSIKTTAPVVAYDIYPYGGAASYISSATLLVPVSAWGDNYIGVIGYPRGAAARPLEQPFLQLVAAEDATEVRVRAPTGIALVGNGSDIAAGTPNQPMTYTLQAGQVLQLKQNDDLTGSVVQSNKPVGLWGGSSCMYIETNEDACDSAHQQLVPARALGAKYVGIRYRDRLPNTPEAPPWRVVGVVDGTQLIYDPSPPPGAPTAINSGEVKLFRAPGPFVVHSQDGNHPFYVAGHMTGQHSSGADFGVGDPEFVSLVPSEQWLRSYVFMTDPTMGFTSVVVTRAKGATGFADVELDCVGKIQGWQTAGNAGEYQYARVDLAIGGGPVGGCNNGRHSIKSTEPFGLTVWGYDNTVSYAYPAGASVKPINDVVVNVVK